MSLDTVQRAPRFRRGGRDVLEFVNRHLPEGKQLKLKDLYKLEARGTLVLGRDGRILIGEEKNIVEQLSRAAGVAGA
jgi:hypothetical protein